MGKSKQLYTGKAKVFPIIQEDSELRFLEEENGMAEGTGALEVHSSGFDFKLCHLTAVQP